MEATLALANNRADDIDARELSARERRRADAARLRVACATVEQLDAAAPAVHVAGLSTFAGRVLGLVVNSVARGFAGACLSAREIGRALATPERPKGYTERWVFSALRELRQLGAVLVTPDYVPAHETKLGALLASYPYEYSRVKNLYRLGPAARGVNPRIACGQVRGQLAREVHFIANCSVQYSGSFSGSGLCADPPASRACEIVDNAGPVEWAEEREGAPLRGGEVCPEAEASDGCSAAPTRSGALRGLGSRLWRFLRGERRS